MKRRLGLRRGRKQVPDLREIDKNRLQVPIEMTGGVITVARDVFPPINDQVNLIFKKVGDLEGKSVLDLGCGSGVNTVVAAKRGGIVTASDVTKPALDCTRQNIEAFGVEGKTRVVEPDLFKGLRKGKYDVILFTPSSQSGWNPTLRRIYDYIKHVERFYAKVNEHHNPGGRIFHVHSEYPESPESVDVGRDIEGLVREFAQRDGYGLGIDELTHDIDPGPMIARFLRTRKKMYSRENLRLYTLTKDH